ncbi:MAG: response regulator transcription factor [Erysipelotrichia bacterium]|nr:response regulator transcription factor [Erysipelotrichia bacterium]
MRKILIIEDEENIRKIIAYDLNKAGFLIEEASDGKEGLEKGLADTYDLILIDWMLPQMSGIELLNQFREHSIDSILFMLTAKDGEEDIVEAFEAGADDYMSKPFSPRELLARINAHLKRMKKDSENKEYLDIKINDKKRSVQIGDKKVELTKKEYDLLEYFILNNNIVLSRDKILNDLWGFDYDGDTRIVDVHTFKLRSKLKESKASINSSRGVGYIMEARDE